MGSFYKVELGKSKGKPGNSLKSLIQVNKLEAASHFFSLSLTKKISLTTNKGVRPTYLVCYKLKSHTASSLKT